MPVITMDFVKGMVMDVIQLNDVKGCVSLFIFQLLARLLLWFTPLDWLYQPYLFYMCLFLSVLGLSVAGCFYQFTVKHVFNRYRPCLARVYTV